MEPMLPTIGETATKLMFGIMRDALVCLLSRNKRQRAEARAWLLDSKGPYSVFSSTTVMAVCGLDPIAVRERVLARRKIIILRDGRGSGRSVMGRSVKRRRVIKRKALGSRSRT
jgi:hypothetical protein